MPDLTPSDESSAVKPGWQTSEFWATTAVSVVGILNQAFNWHIPTETVLTIAGLVASYVLSRTFVKKNS